MLKRYLPLIVLVVIAVSCSKDKYQTKPSIEIKSVNGSEFFGNQEIIINFDFTDEEGDVGGGELRYFRNRLNVFWPVLQNNEQADTIRYTIPTFPKTTSGEFQLKIPASFLNENAVQNDTVEFKVVVQDLAGNVSDTIKTPVFIDITQ